MRKLVFIIVFLLLSGCAATNKAIYTSPQHIKDRGDRLFEKVATCMNADGEKQAYTLFIMEENNARVDIYNNVIIGEGLLYAYDDNTVAFIFAHEISHIKLHHVRKNTALSVVTTGIFVAAGFVIPGIGLLNHIVNPLATNAYGKSHELAADKMASESMTRCFGISIDEQVHILETFQKDTATTGGGIWSGHPSWEDRIANIKKSP